MKRPKPFVATSDGRSLLQRALDALAAAGAQDRGVVAAELPAFVAAAAASGAALHGASLIRDAEPGRGPVSGLEAALRFAARPWTVVVACDMPRLAPDLLRQLVATPPRDAVAVVPVVEGRPQPLHAAYHRRCLPVLQAALRRRALGLTRVLESLDVHWLPMAPSPSFANVNTPEQLARWLEAP